MSEDLNLSRFRRAALRDGAFGTPGSLTFADWTAPASELGMPIAPLHRHLEDDEWWYVLEGALGFRFDDHEFSIPAGGIACAPAGIAHTYWNAAATETRYLIVMPPRVAGLIASLHDPARRGDRSLATLFRDHASELIG